MTLLQAVAVFIAAPALVSGLVVILWAILDVPAEDQDEEALRGAGFWRPRRWGPPGSGW